MGDIRRKLGIDVEVDPRRGVDGFADLGNAARDMARDVERSTEQAERGTRDLAESADNLASSSAQLAGGLGDLGGALSGMPGPLGSLGAGMESAAPLIMGVTGAADLASLAMNSNALATARAKAATVAKTVSEKAALVATKAMTAGQWLLNAAMSANPITLVVLAVAALVAAFVVLYKRSDTVRDMVHKVGSGLATAGRWVLDTGAKVGKFALKWNPLTVQLRLARAAAGFVVDKVRSIGSVGDSVGGKLSNLRERAGGVGTWLRDKFTAMVAAPVRPFVEAKDAVEDFVHWLGKIKVPDALSKIGGALGGLVGLHGADLATGMPQLAGGVGSLDRRQTVTAALGLPDFGDILGRATPSAIGRPIVHNDNRTYITVQGALDPESVTRQLAGMLTARDRRLSGVGG